MRNKDQKEILRIVDAYLEGEATPEQEIFLNKYYNSISDESQIFDTYTPEQQEAISERIRMATSKKIDNYYKEPVPLYKKFIWPTAIAASLLILIYFGLFYNKKVEPQQIVQKKIVNDITPGGNQAILTMSNGKKIVLNDSASGKIPSQQGVDINIPKSGQLVYTGNQAGEGISYNTIETKERGQYQLVLPDGTKVWINASSSLKYPIAFTKKDREVELTGEAYFEVAPNKHKPFKVISDRQKITVLGTHFNVNSYATEPDTKTTLLEGSVKVNQLNTKDSLVIKPGQEASVRGFRGNSRITVRKVDVDVAIAWKNGYFMFDAEPLEGILKQVARWYGVQIVYKTESSKHTEFSGTISKYSNVSQVLKVLELTETVKLKLDGNIVTVSK